MSFLVLRYKVSIVIFQGQLCFRGLVQGVAFEIEKHQEFQFVAISLKKSQWASPENLRSLEDVPLEAEPVLFEMDMDELFEVGVVASAITLT